jgi:hypothetical protein
MYCLLLGLAKELGHFFPLLLAADMSAELSFAELEGTLIFANLEQFHHALLVRSLTSNLADYVAHEFYALGGTLQNEGKEKHVRNQNFGSNSTFSKACCSYSLNNKIASILSNPNIKLDTYSLAVSRADSLLLLG